MVEIFNISVRNLDKTKKKSIYYSKGKPVEKQGRKAKGLRFFGAMTAGCHISAMSIAVSCKYQRNIAIGSSLNKLRFLT